MLYCFIVFAPTCAYKVNMACIETFAAPKLYFSNISSTNFSRFFAGFMGGSVNKIL